MTHVLEWIMLISYMTCLSWEYPLKEILFRKSFPKKKICLNFIARWGRKSRNFRKSLRKNQEFQEEIDNFLWNCKKFPEISGSKLEWHSLTQVVNFWYFFYRNKPYMIIFTPYDSKKVIFVAKNKEGKGRKFQMIQERKCEK